ncbi:hypothetical protein L861_07780 [Litchfieldella anticariensis FP35 = DSM 16096]|uniref:4-aminobutyrate aminotransferase n=1 Tax=Litchfieldella anticariensis (strain DSM 16096 / CECT 5854 / CIP 108499 / LMG 22089 / FP35) TaxID=1121939 RepID=S2L5K1_LITA3|nr:aspartate aminotransferase family protein [Halomonas anticariensis]EPC00056.1 hypothetical protein L861_07780 [Halomonas anticariensis FP35 = DSM 16096]
MQPCVSQSLGIIHPIVLEKGLNSEVWDSNGKRYIDFVGGIGVLNLGHCHPAITAAAKSQIDKLIHSAFNAVPHQGYLDIAEALQSFIPVGYALSCMLTNSGAEATENALKISRAATGKQAVIAFDGGFHGRTLAALNLNGKVNPYKVGIGTLPGPVYHIPFPSPDNGASTSEAIQALDRLFEVEISSDEIACIIVEPVQGEGGFRVLDHVFAKHLRKVCDERGIVLIMDEIQSGFGRTGTRFAFTHLGIEPDLLLMGKSMASGLPLAAVAGRESLMSVLPKGGLGGTYSGNAVACAAAKVVMEVMSDANLSQWSNAQESLLLETHDRWKRSQRFPMLGPITGIGSMRGIVFEDTVNATAAEHLAALLIAARQAGVLLMPSGRKRNVLRLLPPLTISQEHLSEGLSKIERALGTLQT